MDFDTYFKSYGLNDYPFSVFTSEAEKGKFSEIYVKPNNHSIIIQGLLNTSAIVIGERGTGKTALSIDATQGVLCDDKILLVKIEEFSDLKRGYSAEDLYRFLTEKIASRFFEQSMNDPGEFWGYTKDEKIDLSMYLSNYVGSSTKNQLRDKIGKIQNHVIKRGFIFLYNFSRVVLNYGLAAATKVASDALTKHFSSLPVFDAGDKEYFQRIECEVDEDFTEEKRQYYLLEKFCTLIKKKKYKKIYIIIDKIDEDPRFSNDAEDISEYINGMASNNKVLTSDFFHILLFFWTTPFNYIKENVRTQKLTFEKLAWQRSDLERAMERRLSAFSDESIILWRSIFYDVTEENIDLVFEMCNGNPRDLWHILHECFSQQFILDSSKNIGNKAIELAIEKFVSGFNYYEYYPKKANARSTSMDVYSYIKQLLKLDDPIFTKDKLNRMAGTGSSTANYVVGMENMGLVRKTAGKGPAGAVLYEIRDPKVVYAMKNKLSIEI